MTIEMKVDFERILSVLWCEEPNRVSFYEHIVDNEVIEYMTGESIPKILEVGTVRSTETSSKMDRAKEKGILETAFTIIPVSGMLAFAVFLNAFKKTKESLKR